MLILRKLSWLNCTNSATSIPLPSSKVINIQQCLLPAAAQGGTDGVVTDLEQRDILTHLPYNSPVWPAKKKMGSDNLRCTTGS